MTSSLDHVPHLAALLAETGIDTLELTGPAGRVFLGRTGVRAVPAPASDPAAAEPEAGATGLVTVASPGIGIFRRAHPLHEQPLAEEGGEVVAGQVLALLQVGDVLLPVRAPSSGVVADARREEGALTGFGDLLFDILPRLEGAPDADRSQRRSRRGLRALAHGRGRGAAGGPVLRQRRLRLPCRRSADHGADRQGGAG